MKYISETFSLAATDLSNHLSCEHLTQLNRLVATKELTLPLWRDPSLEILIKRGEEHEAAYVEYLTRKGLSCSNLKGKPVQETLAAMQAGVDVLVQAKLENSIWSGISDILIKVPGTSKFGNWSYEVQDTKLAQNTRAATILQLCLYTDLLTLLQEHEPENMAVVKPGDNFPTEIYRFAEFHAYFNLVKRNFEQVMTGPPTVTYPNPVEHCGICNWWRVCDKKRHDDDHLSLVAGIRTLHIEELNKQKINTLEEFATAANIARPKRGNIEAFQRRQAQAKVQLNGRVQNQLLHELLPIEKDSGFNRLPEPNNGDIYFDIEGDPFYPDGGLEYLLGYAFKEKDGTVVYKKLWATNRHEEKEAFRTFMQFVMTRWQQFPNLHIYHFAPYEPSAVKRLARVHAIFEKEVDELLRTLSFVDLHAVFKEALLASVERYSLKDLEKFTQYTRMVELHDASIARKSVECSLELNDFKILPAETLLCVEQYNEDDCLATQALHLWLESLRSKLSKDGKEFNRPMPEAALPGEKLQQLEIRSLSIFQSLIRQLPDDRSTWTDEDHAKWLLAHQIDYFRREDKSAWWEYYRVHEMEHEDLLGERKAITGLQFLQSVPAKPGEKTPVHRYKFPPQEIRLKEDDDLREVKGEAIGKVDSISIADGTIDIKKSKKSESIHPVAVHVFERIDPEVLWTSLMNLASSIDEDGLNHQWPYHASKDLLMKRKPKLIGSTDGIETLLDEDVTKSAIRIALNLDKSILPIQGPPGTGKTHTGAKMIIELIKAKKKIGVTAISHRVIITLFEKVNELCEKENIKIDFAHKISTKIEYIPDWVNQVKEVEKLIEAINQYKVTGGTAWLWSGDKLVDQLDYLFIDEAGQMSLSQALAASRAAKNLILLGDPQQLEQPQKGAHPEGSDVAALTYLLEGKPTMPEGKGLFLGVTRRIHPNISKFTSEIFYEGKLISLPGLENQVVSGGTPFDGAGLFYVPSIHSGNQDSSIEEAELISLIVKQLLKNGKWTNAKNETQNLQNEDILIVAPYNAQVATLSAKMPEMQIGTVDKFQGKEAPVVIYSMTSSSIEDAPRGMSFLFNPNRLNVATSRAKSVCILVASPKLLEADCASIDQMRYANALCRYVELAQEKVIEVI
ncbi:MAG TPA: TM0106 family RecB-like putative nuclease [Cyclobacteriaceae bacterium]|nr:TM0106 family RecB-like putative nuclease [Cyclobacteriaceae bacterium]